MRALWDWLLGRRVSRLDEALAAALYRGIKHDEAMERRHGVAGPPMTDAPADRCER